MPRNDLYSGDFDELMPKEVLHFWISEDAVLCVFKDDGVNGYGVHVCDADGNTLVTLGVFSEKSDALACLPMMLARLSLPMIRVACLSHADIDEIREERRERARRAGA